MAQNYAQNADETSASKNAGPNGDHHGTGNPDFAVLMKDASVEVVDKVKLIPTVGKHEDGTTVDVLTGRMDSNGDFDGD